MLAYALSALPQPAFPTDYGQVSFQMHYPPDLRAQMNF